MNASMNVGLCTHQFFDFQRLSRKDVCGHKQADDAVISLTDKASVIGGAASQLNPNLLHMQTRSVIGCALSHVKAFQAITEASTPGWTLILEDDALLPPHFNTLLSAAWSRLPSPSAWGEPDVIYLGVGSNCKEPLEWINRRFFRPSQTVGTHAYAVTAEGAGKLLASLLPLHQSIDSQIHETLLNNLYILAMSSPDPPPGTKAYRSPLLSSPLLINSVKGRSGGC